MRVLWEHGEPKPAEIQEQFPREIKNSAVHSYLAILVDKGHFKRRRPARIGRFAYPHTTPGRGWISAKVCSKRHIYRRGGTACRKTTCLAADGLSTRCKLASRRTANGAEA